MSRSWVNERRYISATRAVAASQAWHQLVFSDVAALLKTAGIVTIAAAAVHKPMAVSGASPMNVCFASVNTGSASDLGKK